jgi:hypothetical protein
MAGQKKRLHHLAQPRRHLARLVLRRATGVGRRRNACWPTARSGMRLCPRRLSDGALYVLDRRGEREDFAADAGGELDPTGDAVISNGSTRTPEPLRVRNEYRLWRGPDMGGWQAPRAVAIARFQARVPSVQRLLAVAPDFKSAERPDSARLAGPARRPDLPVAPASHLPLPDVAAPVDRRQLPTRVGSERSW